MPTPSVSLRFAALAFTKCVGQMFQKRLDSVDDSEEEVSPLTMEAMESYQADLEERTELSNLARTVGEELRSSEWPHLARNFIGFSIGIDPESLPDVNFDRDVCALMADLEPILGRRIISLKAYQELFAETIAEAEAEDDANSVGEWSEPVTFTLDPKDLNEPDEDDTDADRPSEQRQSDIVATIVAVGTPLQRSEILERMKAKGPGRFKNDLAWMVKHHVLVNIKGQGYWPCDVPRPV